MKQNEPLGVGHFGKVWHVKYVPNAAADTNAAPYDADNNFAPTLASNEEIKSSNNE